MTGLRYNFVIIQETAWSYKGPTVQHHLFEKLSTRHNVSIDIIDYDIYKIIRSKSLLVKTQVLKNIHRTTKKNCNIRVITPMYFKIPFIARISSMITNFFVLKRIIQKKPAGIVIYSLTNGFIGLFFAKIYKVPIIFHYIDVLHELVPDYYIVKSIARFVAKLLLKNVDYVYTTSVGLEKFVIHEGISANNVKLLPNGISVSGLKADLALVKEIKNRFSINDNDFVILFMGALYDFAGLQEIVQYYNPKIKDGLNLKFLILGEEGIFSELKEYVKKTEASWVIMPGRVPFEDLSSYISVSNLCLQPFKLNKITREIVPYKFFEYLAMKKPILSTALPGIIKEFKNNPGVIFSANQDSLIQDIESLANQNPALIKKGEEGFQYLSNYLSWNQIIKILIEKLNQIQKKI